MYISKSYFELPSKYLELKVLRNQTIKSRESMALSDEIINSLIPLRVNSFFGRKKIIYNLTNYLSLNSYLSSVLVSKKLFIKIIRNIIHSWLEIKHLNFNLSSLLYSADRVFVNPKNLKVSFIYIVSDPFIGSGNVVDLIYEIIGSMVFDSSENLSYVTELFNVFSHSPSVYDIEQYLNYLEDETAMNYLAKSHCLSCGTLLKENDKICPVCGRMVQMQSERSFQKLNFNSLPQKAYLSDGVRNFGIFSNPFLIGKIKSNNLAIEKDYISRTHAQVVIKDGVYYITDLNSHNGTFLDGKKLVPGEVYPLSNGAIISFVNQNYQFVLK